MWIAPSPRRHSCLSGKRPSRPITRSPRDQERASILAVVLDSGLPAVRNTPTHFRPHESCFMTSGTIDLFTISFWGTVALACIILIPLAGKTARQVAFAMVNLGFL